MRSIQFEIDYKNSRFFARLILKEHGNLVSELFIKEVVQLSNKYNLSDHLIDWYHTGFFVLQ